jgi:GTP pyrophosphokinase
MINLPESEKRRLIDAEWAIGSEDEKNNDFYLAEINLYGKNRTGLLVDISKVFTERSIDIQAINSKTNKQGIATITISFHTRGKDELANLIDRLRQIESIVDIERATG